MKNLLTFVEENYSNYEKNPDIVLEAFKSEKLTKFINEFVTSKRFASAIKHLTDAKIDIKMSELTDDNVIVLNTVDGSTPYDGKALRKIAKKDGNIRLFFDGFGNCFNVTVGEFTVAGARTYNNYSWKNTYKTVHGAFDESKWMIVLQNTSNAAGVIELRANRAFAKKDAVALQSLEKILQKQRRDYAEAAKQLRTDRMLKDNSVIKWLEDDINDVIKRFGDALKDSFAIQDFKAAEAISYDLQYIIQLTGQIRNTLVRIEAEKKLLTGEENDWREEFINDYQIEISDKLKTINKTIDKLDTYNQLEK